MNKLYTLLLLTSFGVTAQMPVNLLTDGDFEANNAAGVWTVLPEIRFENNNYFFFANVETAGNSYDVNLSQAVTLTEGDTYTLSFEASTGAGNTRSIIAGIGQSAAPYASGTKELDITDDNTITYSFDFVADFAGPYRVLFDMGADVGIVVIDNVSLIKKDVPQDTLYYPLYESTFNGTTNVQSLTFPASAQTWAGFTNTNKNIYPLSFTNGGEITFKASAATPATLKFKFEANPYPNTTPEFYTADVIVSADQTYTVAIPSQGANTFNSAILYIEERDITVNISQVTLKIFDTDGAAVISTHYPIYDDGFDGADYQQVLTFPTSADSYAGFSNSNSEVYPFSFPNGGTIAFKASAQVAANVKFKFEANPYPNTTPEFTTEVVSVSSADDYSVTIPAQGANTFNSAILYIQDRDKPVNISQIVVTATAGDPTTNTTLSDLQVDGETIDGFDATENSYTYKLPVGTTAIPQITATTTISDASAAITQATAIPGDATVLVTGSDGSTTDTYTVSFKAVIPSTAAPTPPARDAAEVISLYSDAYTDVASNFDAGWCANNGAGANSVSEITVAGNATMAYTGNACQGIVLNASVDASTFTNYHVDIFIESGTDLDGKVFNLKFVGTDSDVFKEALHNLSPNALQTSVGEWVSLTGTVDLTTMTAFKEFGITSNLGNAVYYDNLYFYIDDTSGGGGETPTTTTYCSTEVTHFNIAGQANPLVLTVENSGADSMTVTGSCPVNTIDVLIVNSVSGGGAASTATIANGVATIDLTWPTGTMPATTTFEVLWSDDTIDGNNMLNAGDGTDATGNIDTANDCSTANVKEISFYNIDVYPNPASNVINVRSEFTIDNLSVFDLMGRTVKQQISNNKEFSLDVSDLSKGIYLVKLTSGEKEAVTKFIKE